MQGGPSTGTVPPGSTVGCSPTRIARRRCAKTFACIAGQCMTVATMRDDDVDGHAPLRAATIATITTATSSGRGETCNRRDDDCDHIVDEDAAPAAVATLLGTASMDLAAAAVGRLHRGDRHRVHVRGSHSARSISPDTSAAGVPRAHRSDSGRGCRHHIDGRRGRDRPRLRATTCSRRIRRARRRRSRRPSARHAPDFAPCAGRDARAAGPVGASFVWCGTTPPGIVGDVPAWPAPISVGHGVSAPCFDVASERRDESRSRWADGHRLLRRDHGSVMGTRTFGGPGVRIRSRWARTTNRRVPRRIRSSAR